MSHNSIDDFHEVSHLVELNHLDYVELEGNTIALHENYRLHVYTKFLDGTIITGRELPILDGVSVSEQESYAMRYVYILHALPTYNYLTYSFILFPSQGNHVSPFLCLWWRVLLLIDE